MRTKLVPLLALAAIGGGAAAPAVSDGATAKAARTHNVQVKDNKFNPRVLNITKGSTVVWRFVGANPHNIKAISGPTRFTSRISSSGTYRRTFKRAGTWTVVCELHGGMKMTLRVR